MRSVQFKMVSQRSGSPICDQFRSVQDGISAFWKPHIYAQFSSGWYLCVREALYVKIEVSKMHMIMIIMMMMMTMIIITIIIIIIIIMIIAKRLQK